MFAVSMKRGLTIITATLFVVLATVQPSPALAQSDMQAGGRYSSFDSPFVEVAEQLKHSVVYVQVVREREVRLPDWFRENHPFYQFFGPPEDSEPRTQRIPSSGSGIIINNDGQILTNNHVVENATSITVRLSDGSERDATIVGTDPETDLALITIGEVDEDWVAPLGDSDAIRIGEWAIAMGNPAGLEWTLTVGVISAKGRSNLLIAGGGPVFQDFIQTDASINFGNSGGPLANIHGEVIGVNAVINAQAQGIGFAIPINMAKQVIEQLREAGTVRRGYLGMVPVALTDLMREALEIDKDVDGVFVESVENGTPAEDGGLQASDVITHVDGKTVSEVNDFRFRVAAHPPGDKLELTILRHGKKEKLSFTLADRADHLASAQGQQGTQQTDSQWMGLDVTSLDSPRARRMNTEVENGVLIIRVDEDGPSAGKLNPGDIIVEIDQQTIDSIADWREVTSNLRDVDRAVLVKYYPQGRTTTRFVALKNE